MLLTSPSPDVEPIDFTKVEAVVGDAIQRRSTTGLRLLGHGEVSLVLAWPSTDSAAALKRVPPFRDAIRARQYVKACERFFDVLNTADIAIWPTTLHTIVRDDGRVVVYHRQPIADVSQLGTYVLRSTEAVDDHPLLLAIADATVRVCAPTIGFDVQMANWLWDGTTAAQIDFTSPFLLVDARNELVYDSQVFLEEYPFVVRRYLKRELTAIVQRFTTPEGALGDLVANLLKEDLVNWVDPAISTFNRRLGLHLQRAEVQKMFEADAKLFPIVLRLKKGQRWWLTGTGRRYEQLLPEKSTYEK